MLDLIEKRNRDFLAQCRREIANVAPGKPIRSDLITRQAAESRPPCYYLTFDYALRHLREHRRSPRRPDGRSAQWEELSLKVKVRQERSGLSDREALQRELEEGAPSSYYITPVYAKRLFQRLRRRP